MRSTCAAYVAVVFPLLTAGSATAEVLDYNLTGAQSYSKIWQGPYIGAAAGMTSVAADLQGYGAYSQRAGGVSASGGVIMGYNITNGPWVLGVEADFMGFGFHDSAYAHGFGTLDVESDWSSSARLRTGYAWDRVLVFATGGVVVGNVRVKPSFDSARSALWTAIAFGLGMEIALDDAWSLRFEAMAAPFQSKVDLPDPKHKANLAPVATRLAIVRHF